MKDSGLKMRKLRERSDEELRKDVEFALHSLAGELLSAMRCTHSLQRIDGMNLLYAAALKNDVEGVAQGLRAASENLRKVQSAVELLVMRVKEGKSDGR